MAIATKVECTCEWVEPDLEDGERGRGWLATCENCLRYEREVDCYGDCGHCEACKIEANRRPLPLEWWE